MGGPKSAADLLRTPPCLQLLADESVQLRMPRELGRLGAPAANGSNGLGVERPAT